MDYRTLFCLVVAVAAASAGPRSAGHVRRGLSHKQRQAETCTSEACVLAAATIIANMDQTADPCDDFYQYACGGWFEDNVIPDDSSRWGIFYELRDKVDIANRQILETPVSGTEPEAVQKVKNLYAACADTETIEAEGYANFVPLVSDDAHGGWPMIQESWDGTDFVWEAVAGENIRRHLAGGLILPYPTLDYFDTSINILYVDQPSLSLPRSFYLDQEAYAPYIEAYKTYIVEVAAVLARETDSAVTNEQLQAAADNIFTFETQMAYGVVPDDERRNYTEMYNPFLVSELKTAYPEINWDVFFTAVFADTDVEIDDTERVILVEPDFFGWLEALVLATGPQVVSDYLYWRRIMTAVSDGPTEFRDIQFRFESVLYGLAQQSPRWSTCIAKASSEASGLAFAVGHAYVAENFPEEVKAEADVLVNNVRAAFKELVGESEWMDAETQVVANEKADQILQLIGYPEDMQDPDQLDAYYDSMRAPDVATHFLNVAGAKDFFARGGLNSLREAPSRDEWLTQPAIVNAFYSPQHNSITFPAGILQMPFFGQGVPRYLNYGAIGVVIGHEISHGFDDQGRQFDGTGNLEQWWSDETIAAFLEQAQCFIDQYNGYELPELEAELGEDAHVNGVLTQGENIGDNGGVRQAFRAYINTLPVDGEEGPLPGLEQFSAEQMLFIAYAQVWCEEQTLEGLLNLILTDPHSPGKYRVWGPLSNSQDFVDAFECPAGSNMNRDDKCILW